VQRRRVTFNGVKPIGAVQSCFENFYVYGAIEPTTGESFFLELPQLNSALLQIFLNEFAHCSQESVNSIVMDHGSCHTATSLRLPENVVCLFLPPYSPERNPIARLWQEVKAQLAWLLVAQLEELEHHVEGILRQYAKGTLQSLTSYAYVVQAVNALYS
jgi:transposase